MRRRASLAALGLPVLRGIRPSVASKYKAVVQNFIRTADKICQLTYEDGTVIETTWSHPFYIEWGNRRAAVESENFEAVLQVFGWVKAEELRAGYVSKTDKGTLRITKVHVDVRSEEVYNFEVAENHTYLVTDQGVVVHNAEYSELISGLRRNSTALGINSALLEQLEGQGHLKEIYDAVKAKYGAEAASFVVEGYLREGSEGLRNAWLSENARGQGQPRAEKGRASFDAITRDGRFISREFSYEVPDPELIERYLMGNATKEELGKVMFEHRDNMSDARPVYFAIEGFDATQRWVELGMVDPRNRTTILNPNTPGNGGQAAQDYYIGTDSRGIPNQFSDFSRSDKAAIVKFLYDNAPNSRTDELLGLPVVSPNGPRTHAPTNVWNDGARMPRSAFSNMQGLRADLCGPQNWHSIGTTIYVPGSTPASPGQTIDFASDAPIRTLINRNNAGAAPGARGC